ncbi:phage tail protein [Marinobacter oulmenensis]|uniref:Phage tail protein n=1 Tax=Marinobacter oulmenensis TaxID=643747 RepID=A0A840U6A1_9GAMM|nr:phage tail protein [Marinobacter oulmenensis]MBB5320472.1 hypothetical protein [Marinobacter oulmenensis]
MKKLADLRAHLLANVPELHKNPEKLVTFIEDGQVEYWRGGNLSHNYTLPVRLIITDFSASMDSVMVPLLAWMSYREPGLDPENSISFEAEILSNNTYDIAITVNITERVIVRATEAGLEVEHVLPEPAMQMNDDAEWQIISDLQGFNEPVAGDD